MKKNVLALHLAITLAFASPAYCDDFSIDNGLNFSIPQSKSGASLVIDRTTDQPAIAAYLDEIEKKVQSCIVGKQFPPDSLGEKMRGIFKATITLRKDGRMEDVQILPAPETDTHGRYDAFRDAVARTVRNEQPFPQFPPGAFSGYDLVTFEVDLEFTRDPPGAARAGRQH
ncbi:hypothetical protein GALL_370540 [mine drainage metagenome]|uniref:Gram-negative bacterial tonB protein n=1 Tax=mine drainage metagenome TaxID=410659 RepID=A0A1J5QCP1_9ZZZZ